MAHDESAVYNAAERNSTLVYLFIVIIIVIVSLLYIIQSQIFDFASFINRITPLFLFSLRLIKLMITLNT